MTFSGAAPTLRRTAPSGAPELRTCAVARERLRAQGRPMRSALAALLLVACAPSGEGQPDASSSGGSSSSSSGAETTSGGQVGCTKDADCKGDRICEAGVCVAPPETTSTSGDASFSGEPPATTGDTSGDEASSSSTGSSVCGDGVRTPDEECDDGNDVETDDCVGCAHAVCGDGAVWVGHEECDDGADNGAGQPCHGACKINVCGDGDLAPDQPCDDANTDDTDACTGTCQPATCGDGFVWAGKETCDDGNAADGDGCDSDCIPSLFEPDGFAQDVAPDIIRGWTLCYDSTSPNYEGWVYSQFEKACLKAAGKTRILLACSPKVDDPTLTVASGLMSDMLFEANDPPKQAGSVWWFGRLAGAVVMYGAVSGPKFETSPMRVVLRYGWEAPQYFYSGVCDANTDAQRMMAFVR